MSDIQDLVLTAFGEGKKWDKNPLEVFGVSELLLGLNLRSEDLHKAIIAFCRSIILSISTDPGRSQRARDDEELERRYQIFVDAYKAITEFKDFNTALAEFKKIKSSRQHEVNLNKRALIDRESILKDAKDAAENLRKKLREKTHELEFFESKHNSALLSHSLVVSGTSADHRQSAFPLPGSEREALTFFFRVEYSPNIPTPETIEYFRERYGKIDKDDRSLQEKLIWDAQSKGVGTESCGKIFNSTSNYINKKIITINFNPHRSTVSVLKNKKYNWLHELDNNFLEENWDKNISESEKDEILKIFWKHMNQLEEVVRRCAPNIATFNISLEKVRIQNAKILEGEKNKVRAATIGCLRNELFQSTYFTGVKSINLLPNQKIAINYCDPLLYEGGLLLLTDVPVAFFTNKRPELHQKTLVSAINFKSLRRTIHTNHIILRIRPKTN